MTPRRAPGAAEVPESVAVNIRRRSYTIAPASPSTPRGRGGGFAHGRVAGGHSLLVRDGRLHYVYNWLGERIQTVAAEQPLPTGRHVVIRSQPVLG